MYDLYFGHIRTPSPCMKCLDRAVGCHGSCDSYKAWKDEGVAKSMETYGKRVSENDFDDYIVKNSEKRRKQQYKYGYKRRRG